VRAAGLKEVVRLEAELGICRAKVAAQCDLEAEVVQLRSELAQALAKAADDASRGEPAPGEELVGVRAELAQAVKVIATLQEQLNEAEVKQRSSPEGEAALHDADASASASTEVDRLTGALAQAKEEALTLREELKEVKVLLGGARSLLESTEDELAVAKAESRRLDHEL
ncbi:unnamed protein product, partial [Chrysoparadoxa australica]